MISSPEAVRVFGITQWIEPPQAEREVQRLESLGYFLAPIGIGEELEAADHDIQSVRASLNAEANARIEAEDALAGLRALAEAAFMAGFKHSGEGWNGEYPFEGMSDNHPDWDGVKEAAFESVAKSPAARKALSETIREIVPLGIDCLLEAWIEGLAKRGFTVVKIAKPK